VHFDARISQLPIANVIAAADRDPNRARGDLSEVWENLGDTVSKHLPMDKSRETVLWPELMASPISM